VDQIVDLKGKGKRQSNPITGLDRPSGFQEGEARREDKTENFFIWMSDRHPTARRRNFGIYCINGRFSTTHDLEILLSDC
jgi:hypothetical protein